MAVEMIADRGWSFLAKSQENLTTNLNLVKAMSTAEAGTSRPDEILEVGLCNAASDNKPCVGIALGSIASGEEVAVATQGIYRLEAAGNITVGQWVSASADPQAVQTSTFTCTGSEHALSYLKPIGTALSTAASGEHVFVKLNI